MPILSSTARVAGIAGWPVAHSRSPRIHGFWLRRHAIDGAYIPLPIQPANFAATVRALVTAGLAGINVTIPHKLAAFDLCDSTDDTARRAGAVNTLVFRDGQMKGSNTDGFGFLADLSQRDIDAAAGPVLVLGGGGAARAIAASLLELGIEVTITNRSSDRAGALAGALPGLHVVEWHWRSEALRDHAMVVNATSLGMTGQPPLDLDLSRGLPALVVVDIVYVPLETPLLRAARAHGMRAVDGLGMLLHQARPGFSCWFGVDPTVDQELRRFVTADLV